MTHRAHMWHIAPSLIVFVVLGAVVGLLYWHITTLTEKVGSLSGELASTSALLAQNTTDLSQNITDLRSQTVGLSDTLSATRESVAAVDTKVGGVENTVGAISGAVGTLQKLSQTDPELLKKYSKVFFLNENYVPAHLVDVPADYAYSTHRTEQYLQEAWPFLEQMLNAAKADGITIYVFSAYRSFAQQKNLKSGYSVTYGAGTANAFSADQGYSEHQLGTALDLIMPGMNGAVDGFDKTAAYTWLQQNAYRFGFELSYPKGNSYYVFEPWHWRFVGVSLATSLHNSGKNFYGMDQRDIDTYLAAIFDPAS